MSMLVMLRCWWLGDGYGGVIVSNLTPKQEKFCLLYMECGNASEAYRKTYDTKSDKPETANRLAKQLLDNIKIASRIDELRGRLVKKSLGTVESLIVELEESRKLAINNGMPAPAVSATMGKAKLLGLDVQKLDLSSTDGTMTPKTVVLDASKLSTDTLNELLAARERTTEAD